MVAVLRAPGSGERDVTFSNDGEATLGNSGHRWPVLKPVTVLGVLISAGTAPIGADLVYDVLLDGATSLFTTIGNRPRVVAGANEGLSPAPDISAVAPPHWLEVEAVQIGSTQPGSKVDVRILYE